MFFDRAIRNRIGIRLIAEQHLALTFMTAAGNKSKAAANNIGIVDTKCLPAKIVRSCGYHVESLCEGAYGKGTRWLFVFPFRALYFDMSSST